MQIGEILREKREEKNISLDQVQEETKIQKRYLEAIEQDNFRALPGKFYARAFIKEYALVVGLDPNEVLKDFDETDIPTDEPKTQYTRMSRTRRSKEARGSSFWSFLPTVILIILIIGIIFVAWTLLQQKNDKTGDNNNNETNNDEIILDSNERPDNNQNNEDETDNNNDENEETSDENNETSGEEDAFEVVDTGEGNFPESTLDFTYSGDALEVRFDASDDAYTELIGADGNAYFADIISAGDDDQTYDVTDEENIFIKVGNAPGVKIFINDVELEYPVDVSTVTQKLVVNFNKAE